MPSTSEKKLINYMKEKVAPYKHVLEVEFRKELPKTLLGKALRRELRKEQDTTKTESTEISPE